MALYEKLSASSSPDEIAAAYKEFTGLAGGDTADVQKQAVDYLTGLGIAAPAITQAYDIYKAPPTGGLPTNDTVVDDGFVDTSATSGNTGALTQSSSNLTSTNAGALDQATSTVGSTTASPFNAINQAFIGGDYAGTASLVKDAGLTPDQIKAYYGFGDDTMNFLKGQGIFGTPTSTVASSVTGATGADTTSGLSTLSNNVTDTSQTASTAQTDWERRKAASDAEAELALIEQQRVAAANVTDLGNGTFKLADGRIFDSNGNDITNATSGLSVLNDADTTTGTVKTYTQAEVNRALADTLSTDPNANRNDVIAAALALGITAEQVNAAYNNLASTSSASGYTKLTSGLSGVAGQGAIEGDDIETQIAQLPTEYAHWERSADQRTMNLIRKSDGAVLDQRTVGDFSDLELAKIGLSFIPGAGQILAGLNVADAVRRGNLLQAAIGVTGLMPGMQNVGTALRVGQAIDQNNPFGAITALAGNTDLQNYFGANNLTIGGYTAKDAISAANLYTASQNGNLAGVIASAGALINSPDTVLAGKALAVMQAAESGNPNALSMAVSAFNSAGGSGGLPTTGGTGSTKSTTTGDFADQEYLRLKGLGWTKDQITNYFNTLEGTTGALDELDTSGFSDAKLAAFNKAKATGVSDLEALVAANDAISGLTSGTSSTTGTTRSLTGGLTSALTTATTTDQFEDLLITSLRSQGLNNAQISTYLENLNNQSTGLSDVGLLAFRQSKLSGATDAEALAAANLASGKTTAAVETDTGTEAELVVTDTNTDFETNIYSFYDTQSETETEIIVTSGLETGQPTELATETETETELVVTSGKETGQDTELSTESEILVTEKKETKLTRGLTTEAEITTEIVVTTASETQSETETESEIVVTTGSETESETETETETETESEIVVTTGSETESETETETETITEVIVTTSSETESETETETETISEIVVTTASETETESESESETETETETISEIVVTTSSETESETETITEILITDTVTESETETETETKTKIVTQPPPTKPPTLTSGSFTGGTPAQGGRGKPTEFLKENLLKTYMTKDSFKDPLAQFNKIRQDMAKDEMMQQGVDPRLAAILAAKMNGEEPPPAPTYNYGEEPQSIDDILGLKVEGERTYAQGGYVQPLMAQGGMALPLLAAKGGLPTMHKGREDFRDGKHVAGEGDGQSDDIPAMLADGEFVFPADVVSALGNGSTKAGTDKLYEMMHSIRDRARSKGRKDLPPPALKSPLDYLKKR
jgi:hypothetical protein